jgi:D-3-phosphoglycerate dehydrogenase
MEVWYHDLDDKLPMGNVRKCTLEELLRGSDVVTVHVDGRESNRNLIGEEEFQTMKRGVVFLNLSRGFVVDVDGPYPREILSDLEAIPHTVRVRPVY